VHSPTPAARQRPRPTRTIDVAEMRAKYEAERIRRLNDAGAAQYQEIPFEGRLSHFDKDPHATGEREQPATEQELDVLIIGCGLMGLTVGVELADRGITDVAFIDMAADFGGTWYWNRYPGLRCDIESYIYLPLLERTGYMPKERYSTGDEILEYCRSIGRDFSFYDKAYFQTRVTGITWDEGISRWLVSTNRGDLFRARFVASQSGLFTRPHLPGIPGVEVFEGHSFHTSRWDYDYTGGTTTSSLSKLHDKRVAVIGTGLSGLQAIPKVAESAKSLVVFQRTPTQVSYRGNGPTDPEWYASLPKGWQRERITSFDDFFMDRSVTECPVEDGWTDFVYHQLDSLTKLGPDASMDDILAVMERTDFEWNEFLRQRVEETVDDPETAELLKAYYRTGCKRLGFSDDFLPTFNRPNVRLVDTSTTPIVRMTPKGIIVGDEEIEVDCIIYATGFVQGASWTDKAGYDVVGRHGELLSAKFKDGMRTFFGILSHGFPNLFFLGLTQVGASANFVRWIVEEGEFLGELISSLKERGIERIEATAEAEEDWCRQMDDQLNAKAAFLSNCTPGYYNNESKVTDRRNTFTSGLYHPGGEYFRRLHDWRDTGEIDGVVLTTSDQSTTGDLSEVAG